MKDEKTNTVTFTNVGENYSGLMFLLMCGFVAPYSNQPNISEEKRSKARELAKIAKSQMDNGEKFEIKEGTELYDDNELFSLYTTELSKLIMIERVNVESAKAAELNKVQLQNKAKE